MLAVSKQFPARRSAWMVVRVAREDVNDRDGLPIREAWTRTIRPTDVWIRRGYPGRPDSRDPNTALADLHGLAGTHRNIVESLAHKLSGSQRASIGTCQVH